MIRFLLDTSFFTALCALALCLGAERLLLGHIPYWNSSLHALIVGGTLLDYNVHRILSLREEGEDSSMSVILPNIAVGLLGLILCLWSLPDLPPRVVLGCLILAVMAFGYSTPLLPFPYKKRLKDYGLLKIHMLTGVWVAVGTIIPALYWGIPLKNYWIEILVRSLLIFPLCIAFDIRDLEADKKTGIHTLPQMLGVRLAYRAVNWTLVAFLCGGLLRCWYRGQPEEVAAYVLSAIAAYAAIYLSRKRPEPFVYLILVDGVMCLYGLLQAFL